MDIVGFYIYILIVNFEKSLYNWLLKDRIILDLEQPIGCIAHGIFFRHYITSK